MELQYAFDIYFIYSFAELNAHANTHTHTSTFTRELGGNRIKFRLQFEFRCAYTFPYIEVYLCNTYHVMNQANRYCGMQKMYKICFALNPICNTNCNNLRRHSFYSFNFDFSPVKFRCNDCQSNSSFYSHPPTQHTHTHIHICHSS